MQMRYQTAPRPEAANYIRFPAVTKAPNTLKANRATITVIAIRTGILFTTESTEGTEK